MSVKRPERNVDDQPSPADHHGFCSELACVVLGAHARRSTWRPSAIVHRPARHEHPRSVLTEHPCDAAPNAEGSPGDNSDFAFQISHW
jgi:hypothetical protein